MFAKCQCTNCSQLLAYDATVAGAEVDCPNCGNTTPLTSPLIPPAKGEKIGEGEFYVWVDTKAEGPLQRDQLIELGKNFPEMAWCYAGGSDWSSLADFQTILEKVRLKDEAEKKAAEQDLEKSRLKGQADQKTAQIKALRIKKKEFQERKRQVSVQMTAIRNETRRQSAEAGKTWLGIYDSEQAADERRGIRLQKEALLLPLEQKKINYDEILAQIDKQITELESGEL